MASIEHVVQLKNAIKSYMKTYIWLSSFYMVNYMHMYVCVLLIICSAFCYTLSSLLNTVHICEDYICLRSGR